MTLTRPLTRAITQSITRRLTDPGAGGGVFDPASLFALGEAGAWHEPSDLATLSQTSTGPLGNVAVGDPVGYMADKSGNGYHQLQATAGNRPILRQDSNGKYYLEFDGLTKELSATLALTQPYERVAAFQQIAHVNNGFVFNGGSGGHLYQVTPSPRLWCISGASPVALDTAPVGQTVSAYQRYNGTATRFGTSNDFFRTASAGTGNITRWGIGGNGGSNRSNIRFYGGLMRAGTMTNEQVAGCHAYFSALAGVAVLPETGTDELLIVAGQSNALSLGTDGQPIPAAIAAIDTARVKIWNGTAFVGYVAGTNSEPAALYPACWGPEAQYAVRWLADNPVGTLYIVKRAIGGTAISTWIPGGGNWNPQATWHYAAKAVLASTPHRTRALWAQGETDAANLALSDAYATNLPILLDGLRYQWGARQIAVMRVSGSTGIMPYLDTVRAAQLSVCQSYDNAHLINTDDLPGDGHHYAAAGIVTMGDRMYDAILAEAGID